MTTEKKCAICLCPEDHCVCDESWPHEWKSRALAAEAEVERLRAALEKAQLKIMPAVKSEVVIARTEP